MSPNFLQLRHLRYFLGIVDAGSFTRAAGMLHVAQPALSQQMAALEAELGVALLQRGGRGIRPTAAGELFYREAASIIEHVEQLGHMVRSAAEEPEGLVRLGMSSGFAVCWACDFMEACRVMLPKVHLRLVVGDMLRMRPLIATRALDICVLLEDEPIQGFTRQPLFHQPLSMVGLLLAEDVAHTISLERLAQVPLVLPTRPNAVRSVLDRAFQEAGLSPNCIAEVDTFASALSLVNAGIGNVIVPNIFFGAPGHGDLRLIAIDPPLHVTACLVYSGTSPPAFAARAVGDLLITHVELALRNRSGRGC
ncbi:MULTISPECIES: LysR substrate-binding domain-containing protein [Bradyrhizobium]|uniref:LysR substrate-binding domain-containing protein n=1 Tax=Bradyrhizobium TaxID=374 RepID=UPI0006884749|nr:MULTISPECIES: LysR substrate-binding domain-containing protein [Bradyrhizobium]WLB24700.1 LysR substrate-binding domain-containing protein [Bradyrhizobium japonicum]